MQRAKKHILSYFRTIAAVMFLSFISGCPPLWPPSPPPPPPPEPPFTLPSYISGFTEDQSIGKKIKGVNVKAKHKGTGTFFPNPGGLTTGVSGQYFIGVMMAGTYEVYATHPSHATSTPAYTVNVINENEIYPKPPDTGDINMPHNCTGDAVRILGATSVVYKQNLQSAISDAADSDTVQSQNVLFMGDITCNDPKSITVIGGFDSCFDTVIGTTKVQGTMTINGGGSTIEYFEIQKP